MRLVAGLLKALLWLVTTIALAIAVPSAWMQVNVVDADGYAAMAQDAATDPALQAAVASELATEAMALITKRGYSVDPALVRGVATAYTEGPSFPAQFAQANRAAQHWMFADDQSAGPLVIDLAPMLNDSAFQQTMHNFNVRVPTRLTVPLTVGASQTLRPGQLRLLATWNPWVTMGATALAGICALLTLASAGSRGKALASLGVSALLAGAGGWAGIEAARRLVKDALDDTTGDIRRIADAMIGHAEGSLHQWLDLTLAAGGVLVVLGVFVAVLGGLRKVQPSVSPVAAWPRSSRSAEAIPRRARR